MNYGNTRDGLVRKSDYIGSNGGGNNVCFSKNRVVKDLY